MSQDEIPGHLPRGRACQACRMRKLKCDGNHPVCNQCVRFNRESECVLVPGPAPSNTRMLEQEIKRLESLICDLERRGAGSFELSRPLSSPSLFPANWWEPTEPPRDVEQTLVQVFLPHASKFGFFLDMPRFIQSATGSASASGRIPAVLRYTMYLWGAHIVRQGDHENVFLRRTLQHLPQALSNPTHVMYTIQTEILLAYYFFESDRLLEGQQHVSGALSLARLCKLHKFGPGPNAVNSLLPAPEDATVEQERINAWWQLFALEKAWTTASDTSSLITERGADNVIDTPWPRDQGYQSAYGRTVKNFLANVSSDRTNHPLALYAKAAALYEKAAYVASLHGANPTNMPDVNSMIAGLDVAIEYFKQSIPTVGQPESAAEGIRHDLLVIHTLAQCATIALHKGSAHQSPTSRSRCLTAANAIVGVFQAVKSEDLAFVNPILAVTASTAHEILMLALGSLRGSRNAAAGQSGEEGTLLFGQDTLKGILSLFAASSPLFLSHLRKVHSAQ